MTAVRDGLDGDDAAAGGGGGLDVAPAAPFPPRCSASRSVHPLGRKRPLSAEKPKFFEDFTDNSQPFTPLHLNSDSNEIQADRPVSTGASVLGEGRGGGPESSYLSSRPPRSGTGAA